MRLLEFLPNGDICLTKKLLDNAIPPYAILSHTWGDESQEVIFEDMDGGSGRDKAGYAKIKFCGEQAASDGLQYFWVDSCCIKKSSDAELSESINSMFRWYQRATKCYVYLSDVSTAEQDDNTSNTWEHAFRESKWFTRGWTLQELLAPRLVEFFTPEGKRLGDKRTLEHQIHEITGIAVDALRGTPMSQFGIDERFSWARGRRTTRKEDEAYSLLGIFSIFMPLIYGEGRDNAVNRLRKEIDNASKDTECLRNLYLTDPREDKTRIEQTKGGLLQDSYRWILEKAEFQQWRDDRQNRLLWIKGDPGKGKTMLLCGIVDELKRSTSETGLLSFFFCQGSDSRINNATAVLRGLIYLLIDQQPSLISHVRKKYDHAGQALFESVNAWVSLSEIFANILQDPSLKTTYLIIDALDECVTDLPQLLNLIVQKSSASSQVKWIVSSRNWPKIEERLEEAGQKVRLSLEINAELVSTAVTVYIQYKVRQLAAKRNYNSKTESAVREYLSLNANGTFLWVALVCQSLESVSKWRTLEKLKAIPPGLDALYMTMIQQVCASEEVDLCKQILTIATIAYRPLSLKELTALVEMSKDISDDLESLREIVGLCGSFLTLRESTVYFVHQSAKDFLLKTASSIIFSSNPQEVDRIIFLKSLEIMSRTLRRDIYGLHAPGFPIDKIQQPDPDPLTAAGYSCVYWVDHLCRWCSSENVKHKNDLQDGGTVDKFLRRNYLPWLEALCLLKSMSEGVLSVIKLERLLQGRAETFQLSKLVRDARRFILYHRQVVENSPLQLYASALLFSPVRSVIRELFKQEEPEWIATKPRVEEDWSATLQTLEGHSSWVDSVAFSPDGKRLASGSDDSTIRLWDAESGEPLQTLKAHSSTVRSVAFSLDGKRLASGSDDRTVRLWDAKSGEPLHMLEGHSSLINSIAFSLDGKQLASGSEDRTIKLWDVESGEPMQTLKDHSGSVNSVAFSPDGKWLASGSDDRTIKLWDAESGEPLQTLEGHSNFIRSIAFSPDGKWLASGSYDRTVRLWDVKSGEPLQTLEGHNSAINSIAFSPDSKRLASGSYDKTVRLWDVELGEPLQTLEGHNSLVYAITFSPDSKRLASGSDDWTVRLWDAEFEPLQTLESHSSSINLIVFSPDGKRLASGSYDKTVRLWDAESGEPLQILEGHSSWVNSIAFSPDGKRLASSSDDWTVRLWDTESGEPLQTLDVGAVINQLSFSVDGSHLNTNRGLIRLDTRSSDIVLRRTQEPLYLFVSDQWVMLESKKLLWLPAEYRATCVAVEGQRLVLGHSSGRVSIFSFNSKLLDRFRF